mgnify:CR=1 FL=1
MESPPPPSDRVGETVGGRYVLRRLIGVGGYSAVYEATHAVTGRVVALKLLHPGSSEGVVVGASDLVGASPGRQSLSAPVLRSRCGFR